MSPPAPVTVAWHGVSAEPVKLTGSVQVITVLEVAVVMPKLVWVAVEPVWLVSPAHVELAVAVPTLVFVAYVIAALVVVSPAPVITSVHGVSAEPVYVTDAGQVMTFVEVALVMVKLDCAAVEPVWLASPAHVELAVAVPTLVLEL